MLMARTIWNNATSITTNKLVLLSLQTIVSNGHRLFFNDLDCMERIFFCVFLSFVMVFVFEQTTVSMDQQHNRHPIQHIHSHCLLKHQNNRQIYASSLLPI